MHIKNSYGHPIDVWSQPRLRPRQGEAKGWVLLLVP